jgi:uncharacterized protein (DUF1778 family)
MNYKPDEGTLIAYLYGELDAKESEKVAMYLEQHPQEKAKLNSLSDVSGIMGNIRDKEVIAPPIFLGDSDSKPLWNQGYFRVITGIAASILFILVAGRLLGPEISYTNGELKISFGKNSNQPVDNRLTEAKIQSMIQASLTKNNEELKAQWSDDQRKLVQSVANLNSSEINNLVKSASQASQQQVRSFVSGLQEQNLKLMKDYLQLSSNDQKKYMETLLVDFSNYLQDQRKQDLMIVQSKVSNLEKNSNLFKQETEQILASLISSPSNKKNY